MLRNRPLKVFAMARPKALPVPARQDVYALTKPEVFDRWSKDASGVRALQMDDNVITIFDVIGEDFWTGGGVTAKRVASQLRAIGDRPVEVQINSPGGDVFEGIAIYNVLREHPQPITIKIMGFAASAASVIAMAGDKIMIGAASFVMIHNTWVVSIGNRNDMLETAAWLEPFDRALVDVYAARTGQSVKDITKWLDDETYMSGASAIERGFADELLTADKLTVDEDAKARGADISSVRAMELALLAQGSSRSEARARINKLRGTTDSAPENAGTTDSAGAEDWSALTGLISTLRS